MYIKIRADIFNSALRAAARAESVVLDINSGTPAAAFRNIDLFIIKRLIPEVDKMLLDYIAVGGYETDPAEAFFSIEPPGMWMRLRELVGPDSNHEGPLKDYLESPEALTATVNEFLEQVEMTQDMAYDDHREALKRLRGDEPDQLTSDYESLY